MASEARRPHASRPVRHRTQTDQREQSGTEKWRIPAYVYMVGFIAALGGLLFGYDTGVISGAQGLLHTEFHLTAFTQELAVSAVLIGTILGAATGGKLSDAWGRKKTLIIMAVIFGAGAIVTALSVNLAMFIVLRIVVGYAIGASSVAAPLYTSELAPPSIRGMLVFLFQFAITVGILVAYAVDYWFYDAGWGWRPMFGVALIPAICLGVGMLFLSDSPRWLASKGKWDEAKQVMERAVPGHADEQLKIIRKRMEEERHSHVGELFRNSGLRVALIVAVGLAVLQQLVGINTIIYYAPLVIGYSGFATSGVTGSLLGAIIVGAVNVLATIIAIALVDRVGRRPLLLFGTAGTCVTLTLTGVLFLLNPHHVGILLLIVILLYIVSFAIGLGPTYWLLADEVFPTRLRGVGSSISTVGNWSANLVISLTFLSLINGIGKSFTFWIYAAFALIEFIFALMLVPETRNRPLEDIEEYWDNGRNWDAVEQKQGKIEGQSGVA